MKHCPSEYDLECSEHGKCNYYTGTFSPQFPYTVMLCGLHTAQYENLDNSKMKNYLVVMKVNAGVTVDGKDQVVQFSV